MEPTKGQFIKFLTKQEPWKDRIGCVLSVGRNESKVSVMPIDGESCICTVAVRNDRIEDYKPDESSNHRTPA